MSVLVLLMQVDGTVADSLSSVITPVVSRLVPQVTFTAEAGALYTLFLQVCLRALSLHGACVRPSCNAAQHCLTF